MNCTSTPSSREARALLEDYAAVDPRADSGRRARQLAALRARPLSATTLRDARDRCVLAHGGLLSAELQQASVRTRLDRAGHEPVSGAELIALRESLARASADIDAARSALPTCTEAMRAVMRSMR